MFVWFITAPIMLYMIFAYFKDASRYLLIPIVVANLVFLFGCTLLSMVVIVFTILHGNTPMMIMIKTIIVMIMVMRRWIMRMMGTMMTRKRMSGERS